MLGVAVLWRGQHWPYRPLYCVQQLDAQLATDVCSSAVAQVLPN